jgi:hypothetical protein
MLNPAPQHHQTENHVIDGTRRWVKLGRLPWTELPHLCDRPSPLWTNRDHTAEGAFDCISPTAASAFHDSLRLIRPDDFCVRVGSKTWDGKTTKTCRGNFRYNGVIYSLRLTDPIAKSAFVLKDVGDYPLNDVYLCVSLTEVFEKDGRCHKLVAAIISNPPL